MKENTTALTKERTEQGTPEQTRGGIYFTPRVDIVETDNELLLYADMPGVRPEDVELRYENGELRLRGRLQPRERPGQLAHAEYEEGDFYRTFQIHESIDSSKIEASCKNGVLTLHLPKVAAAKPRQITVRGGMSSDRPASRQAMISPTPSAVGIRWIALRGRTHSRLGVRPLGAPAVSAAPSPPAAFRKVPGGGECWCPLVAHGGTFGTPLPIS
jgi:HSP20 family protein